MSHGYLFKTYASKASADYIPSLVGVPAPGQSTDTGYFERIELQDRYIGAMSVSRWVTEEGDTILAVSGRKGKTYYIPKSELEEIAAENQDDDTWDMLTAISKKRIYP